jgi:hypothetical protein
MDEEPIHEARAAFMGAEDWDRALAQAWELWFGPEIERTNRGFSTGCLYTLHGASAVYA